MIMFGRAIGAVCERCHEAKPDVRYTRDVRKHLCGECWLEVVPPGGVRRSGRADLGRDRGEDRAGGRA
jgi:hypothetical protein